MPFVLDIWGHFTHILNKTNVMSIWNRVVLIFGCAYGLWALIDRFLAGWHENIDYLPLSGILNPVSRMGLCTSPQTVHKTLCIHTFFSIKKTVSIFKGSMVKWSRNTTLQDKLIQDSNLVWLLQCLAAFGHIIMRIFVHHQKAMWIYLVSTVKIQYFL